MQSKGVVRKVLQRAKQRAEADCNEELSLREAARHSGYSPDYIGKMTRAGRIENVGRKNSP
jgi:hypothetical protein